MDPSNGLQQNIPTIIQFIDRLITRLSACKPYPNVEIQPSTQHQPTQRQNPFSALPAAELAKVKPLMLTLHCLFPNELLLALDILDRGLVRRFVTGDAIDNPTADLHNREIPIYTTDPVEDIFIVLSASAVTEDKGYEVRLQAWNCTCPTFTLSAFRDSESPTSENASPTSTANETNLVDPPKDQGGNCQYQFGGTLTRGSAGLSPPVCKHILASILTARCPALFGRGAEDIKSVSARELAGWCAGWGG
ncbi:hypothetical protein ASPWEDRAFT_120550 [Aspergillus wentii DTO 134E9]|uniref:SWIM-type domain-containing protein n=1 Tax=Aspergillus wentii DTO 134E9 TaxID=1073089 RepID=A0A1L9R742_ASPWE|nr:uncharacterized protein ASPWEDRAFT_120550 [Aspergillus wentii DTO 134E9]KAI9923690.1 hypothetical protein MW887_008423 [Aspergillus wentii]OJJ30724.1 hypothetical protein ASPWEDRAFT_120550 [Aspergillus wentii DTO 134E9]